MAKRVLPKKADVEEDKAVLSLSGVDSAEDSDEGGDVGDDGESEEEDFSGSDEGDDEDGDSEEGEDEDDGDEDENSEESDEGVDAQHAARDLWDSGSDGEQELENKSKKSSAPSKALRGSASWNVLTDSKNRGVAATKNNGRHNTNEDDEAHDEGSKQELKPIIPESDSEEDGPVMRNTVGNVPMEWYKDEKHIGYDLQGKKIARKPRKDTLDAHLARSDDPEAWRTVYDEVNDEELRLTDAEVKLLRRLRAGKFDPGYNPYEDYPDPIDDPIHKIHPLSNKPEPKSRFVPSKHEAKMVVKYVRLMRAGKLEKPKPDAKPDTAYNFDLWSTENDVKQRGAVPIPAPKPKLPGHAESYHPPKEYLLTPEEEEAMLKQDMSDRPLNFVPANYDALRKVPLYNRLLHERFERCLDLYLCPRAVKKRMNVEPQSLVPKLPKPQELKPYPTVLTVQYDGHTAKVNSLAVHAAGQYVASGSDDGTVRVWEVSTGRCCRTWDLSGRGAIGGIAPDASDGAAAQGAAAGEGGAAAEARQVKCVAWNPSPALSIIAAVVGTEVVLLDATFGEAGAPVRELMERGREAHAAAAAAGKGDDARRDLVSWVEPGEAERAAGVLVRVRHSKSVIQAAWHHKGDYLVTLAPAANTRAVLIHQLSRRQSQNPFSKSKADARKVLFHPSKPFLFVATPRGVKVYSLLKQALVKSLLGGFKWLSSFDVHPGGDNVVCAALDRRLSWFDMDLSTKPYRTVRYNSTGLRSVGYHRRLPLFAAGGEDGMVYVFHGTVYADLMQNPLIVPLKRLHAHKCDGSEGVMDLAFHPVQPWLFTCGVDNSVRLFTDI